MRSIDARLAILLTLPEIGFAFFSLSFTLLFQQFDYALIFDCDGVLIETEEIHRLAYNSAFDEFDLKIDGEPVEWNVPYYDVLQTRSARVRTKTCPLPEHNGSVSLGRQSRSSPSGRGARSGR